MAFLFSTVMAMESTITVIEKAPHTCARCRSKKQGCDRLLPACTRCASKWIRCDYSLPQVNLKAATSSSLVDQGLCGPDLSSHGQAELLNLALNNCDEFQQDGTNKFAELALQLLGALKLTPEEVRDNYASSVNHWLQLLSPDQMRDFDDLEICRSESSMAFLCLAMVLVTTWPCSHMEHIQKRRLYTTLQSLYFPLQRKDNKKLRIAQGKALIAIYEVGHGMNAHAYLTISSAVALTMMIEIETLPLSRVEDVHWMITICVLDRMITLSNAADNLPLLCPPNSPLVKCIQHVLRSESFPSHLQNDLCAQRLRLSARVVIATGIVLDYVHFGYAQGVEYEYVNDQIEKAVMDSMKYHGSHLTWFCEPVILSLRYLLILHQHRVRQTEAPPGSKDDLALQTYLRVGWESCRDATEAVKDAPEFLNISLVSIFCTIDMTLSMCEISGQQPPQKEVAAILPILRRFGQRWTLCDKLIKRVELVLD